MTTCVWQIKASFTVTLQMANTLSVEESERNAAQQVAQARSRQLAQLCHEIRNPCAPQPTTPASFPMRCGHLLT